VDSMPLISSLNALIFLLKSLFISCSLLPFPHLVFALISLFYITASVVSCLTFFSIFSLIFYSLYFSLVIPFLCPVCFIHFVNISSPHFNCSLLFEILVRCVTCFHFFSYVNKYNII